MVLPEERRGSNSAYDYIDVAAFTRPKITDRILPRPPNKDPRKLTQNTASSSVLVENPVTSAGCYMSMTNQQYLVPVATDMTTKTDLPPLSEISDTEEEIYGK